MLGGRIFGKSRGLNVDIAREALRGVVDPRTGKDIVSSGIADGVTIRDGVVSAALEIDPRRAQEMEPIRAEAESRLRALPGAKSAHVVLTAHAQEAPAPTLTTARKPPTRGGAIPGVKRVIAVGSGKGGVGKSTVSANLAVALAQRGAAVGLLDGDVYGPSQQRLLGVDAKPGTTADGRIAPLAAHGVKAMSMGFLLAPSQSVVWRGPMLQKTLQQLLRQVDWGTLDYLIVDLPPGTGDVQLSLTQMTDVTGAVIVSTPQDLALIDATKAIDMFRKTQTPILGVVENMSTFLCPHCGEATEIFGHGGAQEEAARLGIPFLGAVPLHLALRQASDAGQPVAADPTNPQAAPFYALADALKTRFETQAA